MGLIEVELGDGSGSIESNAGLWPFSDTVTLRSIFSDHYASVDPQKLACHRIYCIGDWSHLPFGVIAPTPDL